MSADTTAAVAAGVAVASAAVTVVAAAILARRLRELRRLSAELREQLVPLARDARVVVDQAATEMERVGEVLGSAEAVSATVDSASRLAYRAFSNPVVKVLAFGSGIGGALRRFFGRPPRPAVDVPVRAGEHHRVPRRARRRKVGTP
jgi:hypothetical protein